MTRIGGVGWARSPNGYRYNKRRRNLVRMRKGARGNWSLWGKHVEGGFAEPGQMANDPGGSPQNVEVQVVPGSLSDVAPPTFG
jgi:hypothetical protein